MEKRLRDFGIRRLAALQYARDRVQLGMTNLEIAKARGVSTRTIERTLTWAEKAGIFVELEDALYQDIAPIALDAIRTALSRGEDVPRGALEILQGLNILKKTHAITQKEVKEQNDLVNYITQIRQRAELDQATTEGELIERQPLQLGTSEPSDPPGDDSSDPERVPERVGGPVEEAAPEEGPHRDENSVPGDETVGSDTTPRG